MDSKLNKDWMKAKNKQKAAEHKGPIPVYENTSSGSHENHLNFFWKVSIWLLGLISRLVWAVNFFERKVFFSVIFTHKKYKLRK